MPLTDQQLNSYEQGLRKRADDEMASSLGNLGNAHPDYGSQSMTNTINNFNYNRQKQYLDALAAREDLAQKWQQTANQRAMTQGQIKQMAGEHSRGIANLVQQRETQAQNLGFNRDQLASSERNQQEQNRLQEKNIDSQVANWRASHELETQKAADIRRQNAITTHMNIQMQHANMQLQRKQISMQEWAQKTNATLQQMGLQLDVKKIEALRTPPPPDTSHKDMLTWLSNIIQPINSDKNAKDSLDIQRQAAAAGMSVQQMQNKLALMQLGYTQQSNLINNFSNLGMGILGAFV
ncbi:MAG: hypothetical protein LBK92_02840 [Endomicrobium sp.]|jgi:hypothetical protein|nr:hypothetical protein [Endomicrobium sp.]